MCIRDRPWIDDSGQVHVNTGYRVQFNSCLLYTSSDAWAYEGRDSGSRQDAIGSGDSGSAGDEDLRTAAAAGSAGSVSYTHLDVYKRQLMN